MKRCPFAVLGSVMFLVGCGGAPYEVAPVHGTVVINNQPFKQGSVVFAPIAKGEEKRVGKIAAGTTDSEGKYRLSSYGKEDGAVVGKHWVTIINLDEDNMPKGIPEFATILIPEQKAVVAETDNEINIELTREQVLKFRQDDN